MKLLSKSLVTITLLSLSLSAETIHHNGYTYKTVKSPYTGNIWLDRNIGASRVCKSMDDDKCYGDYFQWGRDADGHEKKDSYYTSRQAKSISKPGSKFIKGKEDNLWDWAHKVDEYGSKREANWSKTDGSSVCPKGFRVPSIEELEDETTEGGGVKNAKTAFRSFLKLPVAGYRHSTDGSLDNQGSNGYVWSSTASDSHSHYLGFYSSEAYTGSYRRANGYSVRCLKD